MLRDTFQLTTLNSGTNIKGTLEADVDLRIDGEVEGLLKTTQKIFIGDSGIFKGEATADSIDIFGYFQGSVHVKHKLFIGKSAHLEGEVHVGSIEIEEGAYFQGECFILGAAPNIKDQIETKQLQPNKEVNESLTKAAL